MNSALENGMKCAALDFGRACVLALSDHYQFNPDEAFRVLNLESATVKKEKKEKKEKAAVPAFPLPWTGKVQECWCEGLRLNHGLYSQCNMERCEDSRYCKTCMKQASVNSTGKPSYGCVDDRLACHDTLEYRDEKTGKQAVTYGNVMLKLSITKERAIEEAGKFGLVIPEEQFQTRETKRGRPKTKKDASASDSESETSTKRGRGRPKKEKKQIVSSCGDDMIANLVAESQNHTSDDDSIASTESLASPVKQEEQAKAERKAKKEMKVKRLRDELKKLSLQLFGKETQINSTTKIGALEKEIADVKAALKKKDFVAYYTIDVVEEKEAPPAAPATPPPPPPAPAAPAPAAPAPAAPAPAAPKTQDELIEQAIADDDSDEEEDVTEVKEFTHDGKNYLKSSDNILYDVTTQEEVGVYNEKTNSIDELVEFSSEEEDED